MKKILPITLISVYTALTSAAQYNVIISKEHNDYEKTALTIIKTEVHESEWTKSKEDNCSNHYASSDFYYDKSFDQIKTCDETQSKTVTTTHYYSNNTSEDIVTTEKQVLTGKETTFSDKGTHIESNCKDILDFDPLLDDDSYYIDHKGGMTVDCDMNTDGGGWTKITTANKIQDGGYAEFLFDDGDFTYQKVLFVDNGNIGDFATPVTNKYYDWTGYHLAWNTIKLDNVWYNSSPGSKIPGDIPNKISVSRFHVLEKSSETCYAEPNVVDTFCGKKVVIDTNGSRISGISDSQSISNAALANNYFAMKFFIYVR